MTNEEYEADIAFLLARAGGANCCHFSDDERDTGMSSNSLVAIAYGSTEKQVMPSDRSDLAACKRAYSKLPEHRKTVIVIAALEAAREVIANKYADLRRPNP